MIIQNPETVLVSSAIFMETPMVDRVGEEFYNTVKDGDMIKVDAYNGTISII